jgi:hypothetical protein
MSVISFMANSQADIRACGRSAGISSMVRATAAHIAVRTSLRMSSGGQYWSCEIAVSASTCADWLPNHEAERFTIAPCIPAEMVVMGDLFAPPARSSYPRSPSVRSASLIGHSGSSAFRLSTTTVSMSLTGSCFSTESAPRPFHHGIRERGGTIFWATLPSDER